MNEKPLPIGTPVRIVGPEEHFQMPRFRKDLYIHSHVPYSRWDAQGRRYIEIQYRVARLTRGGREELHYKAWMWETLTPVGFGEKALGDYL